MMNLKFLLNKKLDNKVILRIMAIVAIIGFSDAVYLTANYYLGTEVQCVVTKGCEAVLTSKYASIFRVPLAVWGLIFYAGMFLLVNIIDLYQKTLFKKTLLALAGAGFGISVVLFFIQIAVIKAICFYCILSLTISTALFILSIMVYKNRHEYYI